MSATAPRPATGAGKANLGPTRRIATSSVPGRRVSVLSLVAGAFSLLAAPAVFGSVGVALGTVAIAKGDRLGGMAGIGASSALAVTGFDLALNLPACLLPESLPFYNVIPA